MKRKLMNNIICFTICSSVFAGLFSVSGLPVYAVSQETQNAIDEAEEEKEQLEETLEEQEEGKENLEDAKQGQEQRLSSLKQQYQAISKNLEALEQQASEKAAEIETKTAELDVAVKKQQDQYEDMKLRIQYTYEAPKESIFTLLLRKLPIAAILNDVDNTAKIQEYDRKQLKNYAESAEKIKSQKEELETAHAELETLVQEAKNMQSRMEALQLQTKESISQYLNRIAQAEEAIGNTEAALQEKSQALQELYAKAQAEEEAERQRQAAEAAAKLQEAMGNGSIKAGDSGIVYGEITLSQAEMDMLTAMIYCESRGESYEGQLAVGHVIMNRVRSTKYPNTLEGVLRQNLQFEPAGSGRFDIVLTAHQQNIPGVIGQAEWESCEKAAKACVNGQSNVGESLFFRTHKPVPQLAQNLEAAGVPYWIIGNHIFYYSWMNY